MEDVGFWSLRKTRMGCSIFSTQSWSLGIFSNQTGKTTLSRSERTIWPTYLEISVPSEQAWAMSEWVGGWVVRLVSGALRSVPYFLACSGELFHWHRTWLVFSRAMPISFAINSRPDYSRQTSNWQMLSLYAHWNFSNSSVHPLE